MIGANRHAFREYIKRGVGGGGGRMAIKYGLGTGVSLGVGLIMDAETPEDTAKRTAQNNEDGPGPGSATLLSAPPSSNHSSVLGGQVQIDHAEVPFAKRCPVNVPKYTKCHATRECRKKKASRYEEKTKEKQMRKLVAMRRNQK